MGFRKIVLVTYMNLRSAREEEVDLPGHGSTEVFGVRGGEDQS